MTSPPAVVVEAEQYNRLVRLLSHDIQVQLRISIAATFYEAARSFNVIAEIPGSDRRDEFVMVGAHLDSRQGGTGAVELRLSEAPHASRVGSRQCPGFIFYAGDFRP